MAQLSLFADVKDTIERSYPDLVLCQVGEMIYVNGSFPVLDGDGAEITRFAISLEIPMTYPEHMPVLRETFGRIPVCFDRHVNLDGTCCVGVPFEWAITADDTSFGAFMAGPVRNYFLGQALVEQGEPWPFGERPHGATGGIEAYCELLAAPGSEECIAILTSLHSNLKGHRLCPCGNGSKFRKCHAQMVGTLKNRVSSARAQLMIANLKSWVSMLAKATAQNSCAVSERVGSSR